MGETPRGLVSDLVVTTGGWMTRLRGSRVRISIVAIGALLVVVFAVSVTGGRWSDWIGSTNSGIERTDAQVAAASATGAAMLKAPLPNYQVGLVDPATGVWRLYDDSGIEVSSFYYGNPGDYPIVGDWDCDGIETPGMYRRQSGYVYLRNANSQGVADLRFFFGNPGDLPLAGDFNGDGCDTVSIYRPSTGQVFVVNELGADDGGLGAADHSYYFGDPGDKAFVGDFDGDGIETVGLHRESTGLVYFRNSHTQGPAHGQFIFGNPGDRIVAGDWTGDDVSTPAVFRPSNVTMYFRHANTQGIADNQWTAGEPDWIPVAGYLDVVAGAGFVPFADDFDGPAAIWPEGSVVGLWQVRYDAFGEIGLTGKGTLRLVPRTADKPGKTFAALVTSTFNASGDVDIWARATTVDQLRTGSAPNSWEVAWLVWHHLHDHRFYYTILKPDGWELGKVDNTKLDPSGPDCLFPSYSNCKYPGAQRFLATGSSPSFPVGQSHEMRVIQVGRTITVFGNGTKLTTYVDDDNPYTSGQVGLYTEDADARFDAVTVAPYSG